MIALILPATYQGLQAVYYEIIGNSSLIEIGFVKDQILNEGKGLDAIFCGLVILFALPFYFWLKKEKQDTSVKTKATPRTIIKALVITLGVGGLTTLILHFSSFLSAGGAEATEALNDTFKADTSFNE